MTEAAALTIETEDQFDRLGFYGVGSILDSREPKAPPIKPCDLYVPDLHIDALK
jgi:hypothetical protein